MSVSSNNSANGPGEILTKTPPEHDFVLPVEAGYRELPPKGSWEAGYQLSLLGLEMIKDRPEIWEQRAARMVNVEFVM